MCADLVAQDTTTSWTVTSTTYTTQNGSTTDGAGRAHWVQAYPYQVVPATFSRIISNNTANETNYQALALDSTSTASTEGIYQAYTAGGSGTISFIYAAASSSVGDHYIQILDKVAGGTGTFYGTGSTFKCSGLVASINW